MMTHPDEDLKLEAYDYELPEELIAIRPASERQNSRLLFYNQEKDEVQDKNFFEIVELLPPETTLVLNQSKVFPCRIFGKKITGARAEFFILSLKKEEHGYPVLIKTGGKKKLGDKFIFGEDVVGCITAVHDGTFSVEFENNLSAEDVVVKIGSVPLPPYIRDGKSDEADLVDYQTVFAKHLGSVAAPTAGLHFTPDLLEQLKNKGINIAFVTLHVGLGTFLPVKSQKITDHKMHSERYHVDEADLLKIRKAKKLVAVGTTSLRVLESMSSDMEPGKEYSTDIFLHPGKTVKSIDGLVTNFHLPKSSLIMLVSSLVGRNKTMEIYKKAVDKKYRFFSYGDSMFIKRSGRNW